MLQIKATHLRKYGCWQKIHVIDISTSFFRHEKSYSFCGINNAYNNLLSTDSYFVMYVVYDNILTH
jgi:hypothetical protein